MHHCTDTPGPLQYRYQHKCTGSLLFSKVVKRLCRLRYLSVHNVLAARGEVLPVEARPQLAVHLLLHAAPHPARRVRCHRPSGHQMVLLVCLENRCSFYVPELFFLYSLLTGMETKPRMLK